MLAYLNLLFICQLVKDFAELAINYCPTGRVVRTVHQVISSSKRRHQVLHVEFEMGEEVHIFSGLEWAEGIDSSVDGGVDECFCSRGGECCFLNGGDNFSYIEAADLFHFEGSSIEISIFPSKLISIRIILEILFCICIILELL